MTWRTVLIEGSCKADLKMGYMVVRKVDGTRRVSLTEISTVIIENTAASVTAALVCELTKRKIKLIFCDEHRNPYGELAPYYGSYDSPSMLRNQMSWDKGTSDKVWTEIVRAKIRMQSHLLMKRHCEDVAEKLFEYSKEVENADSTNREGLAAKIYFPALFGDGFKRRDENVINSCLNYGYAIVLSAVNRSICAMGYSTQLGIGHESRFNHFNLGSDLMEPLRPFVDEAVLVLNAQEFKPDQKRSLANILNARVSFDGKSWYLGDAVQEYCRSAIRALERRSTDELRFVTDEAEVHESDGVLRSSRRHQGIVQRVHEVQELSPGPGIRHDAEIRLH